jgi:histidine triad (HIT) family protein
MKCIFCEIVEGREPASVIYDDDRILAFMSLQPAQPGECLIIPKQHIDHFTDIPDDLASHIIVIGQRIGRKMMQAFSPKRVGMAVHGFGVPHAHLIIVPQHNTDDITSGRFARIVGEEIVFDLSEVKIASRNELNIHAQMLMT